MNNLPDGNKTVSIIICAVNHIMLTALKHISVPTNKKKVKLICLSNLSDIIHCTEQHHPEFIIIDAEPRQCLFLLYRLRSRFGYLPVMFTSKTFLFSDRITSEFFGGVLLRDYDSLMNAFPQFSPIDLSCNNAFAGPEYAGSAPVYKVTPDTGISEDTLVQVLNIWLLSRLPGIIPSMTGRAIIMLCVVDDMSVEKIAGIMQISDKSIYYHRSRVMKTLGIKRVRHDLIKSLRFFKDMYYETTFPTALSTRG
ncbi:hypothetical protein JHS29_004764 [Salmonella enterica]|nr:hypothetical protein [Salmonella enterica]